MLFGMVERGMEGEMQGDKGKLRATEASTSDGTANNGEEAMWAVVLTKELWRKGIWWVAAFGLGFARVLIDDL
jgi:protein SDA1